MRSATLPQPMNSEKVIQSTPQSAIIHKNSHAQTQVISAKSTFYTSSQNNTVIGVEKGLFSDLRLPLKMKFLRDQLLEERPLEKNCATTEDSFHWFNGTIILGMKTGYGKLYIKGKYYYEGKFLASKKHGKGLLIYEDGSYHFGEFFADKIVGDNGLFQDFEFECSKNDMLVKQILDFSNGAMYDGQVLDGKRHGKGSYIWPDGTKYEGSFYDDLFHGLGTMEYADGRKYRGEWAKGQMEGIGSFTWPDNQEYRGQYYQNKKHGFGIFKYKSGIRYSGHFQNGVNHGTGVLTQPNCKPQISSWVNGERIE